MAPTKRHNKKPVIPLTKDTVDDKAEYIKHSCSTTENGITETVEERIAKVGDSFTPRQLLDFLTAFAQARISLHWTTGPKLFQKFRSQLSGVPLEVWLDAIDGLNQTVANFDAALITFKNNSLAGYNYNDQMDYIRSIRKPREVSPS